MPVLLMENVSKCYRHRPSFRNELAHKEDGVPHALLKVNLRADSGDVLAVLGPNGSGKTTLLKIIASTVSPDSGRVLVEGFDVELRPDKTRGRVGFAIAHDRSFFPRLTGRENLNFFAALEEIPRSERGKRIDGLLALTGLAASADKLTYKYSSGMFQRLGVARALLKRPILLLLDEPTRSIDPGGAVELWNLVRNFAESGNSVLITSHSFEEAIEVANRVTMLRCGEVVHTSRFQGSNSVDQLRKLYFSCVREEEESSTEFVQ